TGAAMVFRPTFEKTLNRFSSEQAVPAEKPVSTPADGAVPLSLDEALRLAESATPGAVITSITLPATPTAPLVVRQRQSSEWHLGGRTVVYLDQYSGVRLRVDNPFLAPAGTRAANNLFTIHTGRLGGDVTRILLVFVGFTPATLFATGFMMWLKHLGRSRRGLQGRSLKEREPLAVEEV
ncbi:MAG TPA: PepSY-associated TM helix domain-containing protein, partial [Pyrinomonadaceae bacterium]|nr:PepSY-associated TM helix domain-containing protein [Pyrinomonadaceae bacterium]